MVGVEALARLIPRTLGHVPQAIWAEQQIEEGR